MNIPNMNNSPDAAGSIGRNREMPAHKRTGSTGEPQEVRGDAPAAENTKQPAVSPARDMFQSTAERQRVTELSETIENNEFPVREEAVASAQKRVQEGYYNKREFLGNLATRLVNTDRVT